MKVITLAAALGAALFTLPIASAATLYEEDFNDDPTANWTVNDPGLSDIGVDFFYDYSTIGVPAAPNGTGTRGLKMTANNSGGVFSGFSVSPTGESFSGDYTVTFDLWQNYAGPLGLGGNGTTQVSMFGIGTAGNVAMWPGAATKESLTFGVTLDGESGVDYRIYDSVFPTGHGGTSSAYAAPIDPVTNTKNNGNNPYYAGFGGASAPAEQLALFPGQTGTTDGGEIGFAWREVTIDVVGGVATWSIDGLTIATVDAADITGNILFGHSDTNATSSSDPNDSLLNVTLIDNVRVTGPMTIPEPGTMALAAMAALGAMVALRRRT